MALFLNMNQKKYKPIKPKNKLTSPNQILAKKTLIQALSLIGSLFLIIIKIITMLFWLIRKALHYTFVLVLKILGLPFYRASKKIELKITKYKYYLKEQFGKNFSRNIIIYGGLLLLSIFTSATNIKAREIRPEEIGSDSAIYELLINDLDYEIIEGPDNEIETAEIRTQNKAFSQVGVSNEFVQINTNLDEELLAPLLTQSGDALIKPELTGTDLSPVLREDIVTYVVQPGDTISQIAEQFEVSTNTILWENDIGPRDFVRPGQELVILPVTGVSHTISRGDTLGSIASKYRAKDEDILEVNKLASADELQTGVKIFIPDGIPPTPSTPVNTRSSQFSNLSDIFKPAQPIAGKFNWPTTSRRITQYFRGWRHTGLDIGTPLGQPIYAAESGIVVTSGWNSGGYGNYIVVDHGQGIQTLYAHNSKNYVIAGERVNKGDIIGAIGSTGRSTGPHIHFEVRVGGNRVNPLNYL